jgi:hypothetical protein
MLRFFMRFSQVRCLRKAKVEAIAIIGVALVTAIVAFGFFDQDRNWVEFFSADGGFQVQFPSKPEKDIFKGNTFEITYYFANHRKSTYWAGFINSSTSGPITTVDSALLLERYLIYNSNGWAIIKEFDIIYDGLPGIEYEMRKDDGNGYILKRVLASPQRTYYLVVSYSTDSISKDNRDSAYRFFNCFHLFR